jgi:hypothetical protein
MNKLVVLLVCLVLLAVAIEAKKHHSPKMSTPKRAHQGKHPAKQHHGGHRTPNPKPHGPKRPHVDAPTPVHSSVGTGGDFGDRLLRSFLIFKNQPLTVDDAQDQGFTEFTSGCTQFGHGYAKGSSGPTKSDSAILYFTEAGQLAGFGSRMWGDAPSALIDQGYWMATDAADGSYDLILQTRDANMICSGETDTNLLGDRLWINGIMEIPLAMSAAQAVGWVEGNCIPKMGIHHAFDLNYPFSQSWNASSLVPVMPMYSPQTGAITAVLLASTDAQRIEPVFGDWEGPFINMLFCKNWCANTGCTFPGVGLWTTMHWLFEDPKDNVCDGAKCVI